MIIKGNMQERSPYGGFIVYADNQILDPAESQKIINHSPDGFAWGYGGSGPAQLALSILLLFCNKEFALKNYQSFKSKFVSNWVESFTITDNEIISWLRTRGWEVKDGVGMGNEV